MKRVLVLNGDSYVGRHVVRAFHQSREYDVEITRSTSAHTPGTPLCQHQQQQQQREADEHASLPADIRSCVCGIVPKHNDDTEVFRTRVLANDVVVAVLQDDVYEATCAIRILESTHYEVEKTFVLVSSVVTWAYTLVSERARARLTRQRERQEARDTFFEELLDQEDEARGDGGDGNADDGSPAAAAAAAAARAARRHELEPRLPPSLREPLPGEDEDEILELVPDRVYTEDAYAQRVPHPRFQHWYALEHLVKRANTQTLHTYVVFAGLPYGAGEGEAMLYGLLRSAWYHQTLLQYGPGTNAIPMIHVQDLAAILFKLGNSYDTLEERYIFAVDQGKVTQRQLLQAVQARLGGSVQPATSSQYYLLPTSTRVAAAAASTGDVKATTTGLTAVTRAFASLSGDGVATVNTVRSSLPTHPLHPTTSSSLGNATSATVSADLVKLDRLELPLPSSPQNLFYVFGNEPCWGDGGALLSALVLSDIQAQPAAALNLHPAEAWTALEGFTLHLDVVLAQFREAHEQAFRPVRVMITGPPLSGVEGLAALVARQCHTPLLTLPSLVRDYRAHVANVREALRRLLVRRLQRRRARVQTRLIRRALDERRAKKAAEAERRRERRASDGSDGGDNSDEDDENGKDTGSATAEEREGAWDEDKALSDNDASLNSSLSLFLPPLPAKATPAEAGKDDDDDDDGDAAATAAAADDADGDDEGGAHQTGGGDAVGAASGDHLSRRPPMRPAEEVVDEAYVRGGAASVGAAAGGGDEYGGGDGDDAEMIDEEQEEGEEGDHANDAAGGGQWLDVLEERDAEQQAELLGGQELLPPPAGEDQLKLPPFALPRFEARRRGRAFARDVDRQELRCIAALRREYLLGLKVLTLKVSEQDGQLPRPPPASRDGEDENDDNNDGTQRQRDRLSKPVKGSYSRTPPAAAAVGEDEARGGGEEDESGEGDRSAPPHRDRNAAATENEHEEGETEEEEEAADDDDGADNIAEDESSTYLDQALAFMFRWRLRQSDCRCQGYVLGNFPQTLSQAVLCFKASEAELEDVELRRQRALAPLLTRLDDHESHNSGGAGVDAEGSDDDAPLPPPVDEDFPLPDIAVMEEAQLRALERAHWRARGRNKTDLLPSAQANDAANGSAGGDDDAADADADAPEPEEIMAPVDEALFIDHVVSLQVDPILLRATVEALQTDLKETEASDQQQQQQQQQSAQAGIHGSALRALRRLLSSTPYADQLEDYLRHHATTAPPTQSLLAWLRAVTTTVALGVRPTPVVVPLAGEGLDNAEAAGGETNGAAGGILTTTTTLEAPPTTRTAEVVSMSAPVLSAAQLKASWCFAYETSRSCAGDADANHRREGSILLDEKLPMALLRLAPRFWTGETTAASHRTAPLHRVGTPSRAHALSGEVATDSESPIPPSLCELQRGLCASLVPRRRLAACAGSATAAAVTKAGVQGADSRLLFTTPPMPFSSVTAINAASHPRTAGDCGSGGTVAHDELGSLSTITREHAQLVELERSELQLNAMVTQEGAAQVQKERTVLRKLQLAEDSRGAAALLQMPVETYLMKYVLPSLTPAMTEVVRTRSDDPVTALADVLFNYHRRTRI
ncbi:Dpy-30 motif containing protein [Lotmaria passim]